MVDSPAPEMELRLFLDGHNARARVTEETLRELLGHNFPDQYRLEVIDIRQNPAALEEDDVLATPTLVKRTPPPPSRLIGDFSDELAVLQVLRPSLMR
ncbi:hypothetical protein KAJ83_03585 [Marivibrio halodurans]|uniref:KaiB domain-containing protein n=1 Tax=Marivibrio halodurans TaxID=2039722 RepID=A0A8J7V1G5_9PROT|nr:circadian clock KaiB family protein [Marivibrio halodurans]MBP5856076.1 hypothetical protein [Marivibrio halodurans]